MSEHPRGLDELSREIAQLSQGPVAPGASNLSSELLRLVLDHLPGFVITAGLDGTVLFINQTMPGLERASIVGRSAYDFIGPEHRDAARACLQRVVRTGLAETIEIGTVHPPVASVVMECRVAPIREGDSVIGINVLAFDVSEHKLAEAALRDKADKLRFSIAATGLGLWSWDRQLDQVTWDETTCAMFGVTAAQAPRDFASYILLVHPEDRGLVMARRDQVVADGTFGRVEHRIVRPDGSLRWLLLIGEAIRDAHGRIVRLAGGAIDITERHRLEAQVLEAQKMEAVGQLTAGIAHHFNNLLMSILPNVQLAQRRAPEELQPMLHDAALAATRAAELVRQLTTFAGRAQAEPKRPEEPADLLDQMLAICRGTFERDITIDVRQEPDAPVVVADARQLVHALLNVMINARDAVLAPAPTPRDPRIAIAIERVAAGAPELADTPGALPVDHACIRISDNGVGMATPTLEHLYEPFFTTKGTGSGTGLGLATTYAIVREHGGFIRCASALGRGTTFSIYLPAGAGSADRAPPEVDDTVGPRETILVIDDEQMVRSVVARVLRSAGYQVELASGGEEALARMAGAQAVVKLALVDVSMPGLAGPALVRQLRERERDLRVLYLTGYRMAASGGDRVLEKPVTPEALLAAVRDVLRSA